MQQRVPAHTHHLRPIPIEESAGRLSYLRRVSHAMDADGATLPLILENPAHAEQA